MSIPKEYFIKYKSTNQYENQVSEAIWQFLISPESNQYQDCIQSDFKASHQAKIDRSVNGFGFETVRVICKKQFLTIQFEAEFKVTKWSQDIKNAYSTNIEEDYSQLSSDKYKIDNLFFLNSTSLTSLPKSNFHFFEFDRSKSIFENLQNLNSHIYNTLDFETGITSVNTRLESILEVKKGVCQDYSHLFIAISRKFGLASRYVSGYLHQGVGYMGDSQMHAWVEILIPKLGWIGFDPTNNILADDNHVKVAHGRDYNDCPPIKGIVFSTGLNTTSYSVEVMQQQQQ